MAGSQSMYPTWSIWLYLRGVACRLYGPFQCHNYFKIGVQEIFRRHFPERTVLVNPVQAVIRTGSTHRVLTGDPQWEATAAGLCPPRHLAGYQPGHVQIGYHSFTHQYLLTFNSCWWKKMVSPSSVTTFCMNWALTWASSRWELLTFPTLKSRKSCPFLCVMTALLPNETQFLWRHASYLLGKHHSLCSALWSCQLGKHNACHASLKRRVLFVEFERFPPDLDDDPHNTLDTLQDDSIRTLLGSLTGTITKNQYGFKKLDSNKTSEMRKGTHWHCPQNFWLLWKY